MLSLYKSLTKYSTPFLKLLLKRREQLGKEDQSRLKERQGKASVERPSGKVFWIHAASVGEAQSALILIQELHKRYPDIFILLTTGTRTSATFMEKKLPENAVHQFYPLDHPSWVERFLDHWQPDLIFWMESELWPNMLLDIQKRNIPVALVNGRLSPKSFKRWTKLSKSIGEILATFTLILTQTEQERQYYQNLGAANVVTTDNIKYSASVLPHDTADFDALKKSIGKRPIWLYASTHKGEETLACHVHKELKEHYPDLLTIIVPRHPERGHDIESVCEGEQLDSLLRRDVKRLPDNDTEVYIANTLGELGLFYKLASIACIGRSFSDDGGGGHNPIEAAQLNCAVLHGPNVQNLQDIFDAMNEATAAIKIENKSDFASVIKSLLDDEQKRQSYQKSALDFAAQKTRVIDTVMDELKPLLDTVSK